MNYIAYIHPDGNQWSVEFPDAPGCQTFADTPSALYLAAQEALSGWLEAHLVDGKAPPRPQLRFTRDGAWAMNVPVPAALSSALNIRWARQDQGLSQQQLAERMGVTQQYVAKLENPDENPSLDTIERAARALGFKVDLTFSLTIPSHP